jgi:hypothetical protein
MNSEQVIVYRSKWEAERDQFFFENPEYILYFIGGSILLAVTIIAVDKLKRFFGIRRNRR